MSQRKRGPCLQAAATARQLTGDGLVITWRDTATLEGGKPVACGALRLQPGDRLAAVTLDGRHLMLFVTAAADDVISAQAARPRSAEVTTTSLETMSRGDMASLATTREGRDTLIAFVLGGEA